MRAADRQPAPRQADPARPPVKALSVASELPAISRPGMAAQISCIEDIESEPAQGDRIPTAFAQPSFSAAALSLPEFLARKPNVLLSPDPERGSL
jgi:hypothetical protein